MHIANNLRATAREVKKRKAPRKLLALLLALILSMSTFAGAVPALAATSTSTIEPNPIVLRNMVQYNFYRSDGSQLWSGGFTSAQTNLHYIDGVLVYCLQPNRNSANGVTYGQHNWPSDIDADGPKKLAIAKVLAFGAPNAYEDNDVGILATQLLTWAVACGYVNGSGGLINSGRPDPFGAAIPDNADGAKVRQIYNAILAKMAANATLPAGRSQPKTGSATRWHSYLRHPDGSGRLQAPGLLQGGNGRRQGQKRGKKDVKKCGTKVNSFFANLPHNKPLIAQEKPLRCDRPYNRLYSSIL